MFDASMRFLCGTVECFHNKVNTGFRIGFLFKKITVDIYLLYSISIEKNAFSLLVAKKDVYLIMFI